MLPLDFTQIAAPIGNLGWSALIAAVPLILLFVLLGVFKAPAWISSVATVILCVVLSIFAWNMPFGMSMSAMGLGLFFGLCQIMWLLVAALWVYNLTVKLGWDKVLRDLLQGITNDQRVLALIVAFAFGCLIEGLAGFGTPVAITTAMLVSAGVPKLKAAAACMLGDTAPVAFGSIGAPLTALGNSATGLIGPNGATYDPSFLASLYGKMAGHQSPIMAIIVALCIVALMGGWKGLKDCWHVALICGVSFAIAQFVASQWIGYMITDIIAAGFCLLVTIPCVRVIKTKNPMVAEAVVAEDDSLPAYSSKGAARVWGALAPYAIIIAIFALSQVPPIKAVVSTKVTAIFTWPGLDGCFNATGKAACVSPSVNLYSIVSSGCYLAIAALITTAVYKLNIGKSFGVLGTTIKNLRYTIITIAAVLSIAYVMNGSGMTLTLGTALAATGAAFAFLSPVLGWLGVMLTGSDTSANALFGGMQVTAANAVWPGSTAHGVLMAASNSTGGVLGKMISPQSLSVAAAAGGMTNKEGDIFRKVLPWSLALVIVLGLIVVLQSTVFIGTVPMP